MTKTETVDRGYQTASEWWDDEEEALNPDSFAVHPGLILKNSVLPARNVTGAALADAIAAARPGFNNMLNGKRSITALLALKIEEAIQYPADLLVGLQAQYDLAQARRSKEFVVKKIAEQTRVTVRKVSKVVARNRIREAV